MLRFPKNPVSSAPEMSMRELTGFQQSVYGRDAIGCQPPKKHEEETDDAHERAHAGRSKARPLGSGRRKRRFLRQVAHCAPAKSILGEVSILSVGQQNSNVVEELKKIDRRRNI